MCICVYLQHLSSFDFFAFMSNVAMNICMQVFVYKWYKCLIYLGYVLKTLIFESYDNYIFIILWNCQAVLQGGYTIL